jgi:hypothetical protein
MKSYRMVLRAGNFTSIEPGQAVTSRGIPGRMNCAKIVVGCWPRRGMFRHVVMDEGGETWWVFSRYKSGSRRKVFQREI